MFPFIVHLGPHSFPHLSFIVVVSPVTEGTHHHWSQQNVCLVMFSPCLFPPVCTLSRAPSCVSDLLPCLPEVRSFFVFFRVPRPDPGSPVPRPDPGVASPATGSRGRQSRDRIQGSPVPRPDRRVAGPATRSEGRRSRDQMGGSPVPRPDRRAACPRGQIQLWAACPCGQIQVWAACPRGQKQLWAACPRGQLQLWAASPAASSSSGPPVPQPAPAPAPALGHQFRGQLQLQLQLWAASPAASSSPSSSSGPPVPRPTPAPALGRLSSGQFQLQLLGCHLGLIFKKFLCVWNGTLLLCWVGFFFGFFWDVWKPSLGAGVLSRCVFGVGFSLVCYVYSSELVCFEPHYLLVVCTRDPLLGQCVYVLF